LSPRHALFHILWALQTNTNTPAPPNTNLINLRSVLWASGCNCHKLIWTDQSPGGVTDFEFLRFSISDLFWAWDYVLEARSKATFGNGGGFRLLDRHRHLNYQQTISLICLHSPQSILSISRRLNCRQSLSFRFPHIKIRFFIKIQKGRQNA